MGSRKFGPIKPKDFAKVLADFDFQQKPQRSGSSHFNYEGYVAEIRRVVTVDFGMDIINDKDLVKSMIENSGLPWKVFRDKKARKKAIKKKREAEETNRNKKTDSITSKA